MGPAASERPLLDKGNRFWNGRKWALADSPLSRPIAAVPLLGMSVMRRAPKRR